MAEVADDEDDRPPEVDSVAVGLVLLGSARCGAALEVISRPSRQSLPSARPLVKTSHSPSWTPPPPPPSISNSKPPTAETHRERPTHSTPRKRVFVLPPVPGEHVHPSASVRPSHSDSPCVLGRLLFCFPLTANCKGGRRALVHETADPLWPTHVQGTMAIFPTRPRTVAVGGLGLFCFSVNSHAL